MADMIDPGEDTSGFSNAMMKSITCGNDKYPTRSEGEQRS